MSVSYQELTRLRPASLHEASSSLSKAATKLGAEHEQYKRRVVRPLKAKHGWSGDGQPDAAAVAEVNGLAIDTTRLRTVAGATAYTYAFAGFTLAKLYLAALLKKIEADDMTVDSAGNVSANHVPVGDTNGPGSTSAKVQNYQADIGKVLSFAGKVDRHTADVLDRSHDSVLTALKNRPGLLQDARDEHAEAAGEAQRALALVKRLGDDAKDLPDLREHGIDLPSYDVEIPADTPWLAGLGAALLGLGLNTTSSATILGLVFAVQTRGGSLAAAGVVDVAGATAAALGAVLLLGAGVELSQIQISRADSGGGSGGPSKDPGDLLRNLKNLERQSAPAEPVGKLSFPKANWWKRRGIDLHEVKKEHLGRETSKLDLAKDNAGNVWAVEKGSKDRLVYIDKLEVLEGG